MPALLAPTPIKLLGLMALIALTLFALNFHPKPSGSSYAYVFYATQDTYACSAAVNIYLLKFFFNTKHHVIIFLSRDVSTRYRPLLESLGARIIEEEPMPLHHDTISYYRGCLLKLASFRIHEIDPSLQRIITLDADQLVLGNLDHLFDLPMQDFLAPSAYWLDATYLSSNLMLIKPTPGQWRLVQHALADPLPQQYDIDIINVLFQDRPLRLSGKYTTLNSHWGDWNAPPWFDSATTSASTEDLEDLYHQAQVIHFTAVGKPWSYQVKEVRQRKPKAHEVLFQQWERWRRLARDVCPPGVVDEI